MNFLHSALSEHIVCKKVINNNPMPPEQLETIKMSNADLMAAMSCCNTVSASDLGKLITSLRNQMMAKLDEALKPFDLTAAQFAAIKLIANGQADTLATLCDIMQHDKGAMSRMLCRMEVKDLIVRKPCPHDGRQFKLALSEKGASLFPQTMPVANSVCELAFAGISEAKRTEFLTMLVHCRKNLD
ncbi:MarR family transcriptional regulator [Shewanella sp. C32]|uniref:MarR family transcriptional regulator n=1 Tax=Shewanella electrica TaxID=515560 RepID=A0ABT2FK62_9GAMM|nr:MarR family transcriptional regulator [Shewanella electrica]MCS4556708.1 MarR family transcriptional regulator [Shewanella electrica]